MCETEDLIRKLAAEGKSQVGIAESMGIPRSKLRKYLSSMTDLKLKVYPTYTVKGETGTIPELVKKFGNICSVNTIHNRLGNGMDVEEAFLTPTFGTHTVRGVTGSVEDLVKHFKLKIKPSCVQSRIGRGLDIEEALFIKTNKVRRQSAEQRPVQKSLRSVYRPVPVQQVRVSE